MKRRFNINNNIYLLVDDSYVFGNFITYDNYYRIDVEPIDINYSIFLSDKFNGIVDLIIELDQINVFYNNIMIGKLLPANDEVRNIIINEINNKKDIKCLINYVNQKMNKISIAFNMLKEFNYNDCKILEKYITKLRNCKKLNIKEGSYLDFFPFNYRNKLYYKRNYVGSLSKIDYSNIYSHVSFCDEFCVIKYINGKKVLKRINHIVEIIKFEFIV